MSNWRTLPDAPRDKPIWLFLPSSQFKADDQGRPISVEHEVVVAQWSAEQSVWLSGARHVYPSLWCDAPVNGDAPEPPVLA